MRTTTLALTLLLIGCETKEDASDAETTDAATSETTSSDDGTPAPTGTDNETAPTETNSSPAPTTAASRPAILCAEALADCSVTIDTLAQGSGLPTLTAREEQTYTACGLIATSDFESEGEAGTSYEAQSTYTYDADNYLVGYVSGPFPEIHETYTYDARGRLDVLTEHDWDGSVDAEQRHTYDEADRLIRWERTSFWGTSTLLDVTTYTHTGDDDDGERQIDEGADAVVDRIEWWLRSGDRLERWSTRTESGNTSYDLESYDGDRLVRLESDNDDDGITDFILIQTWDADGRLSEVTADYDADGAVEAVSTLTWTCP